MNASSLKVDGFYNWVNQPERLVYLGTKHYRGDPRTWHQFAKTESPNTVWCEVLPTDLHMLEETLGTTKETG